MEEANSYSDLILLFIGWFIGQLKDIIVFFKDKIKQKYEESDYKKEFKRKLAESKKEAKQIQDILNVLKERINAKNVTLSLYHNGTKDYRGIGLKFWSIVYESPRSHLLDSVIDDYQQKPLSPYYDLIEIIEKENIISFDNVKEDTGHSIINAVMSALQLQEFHMVGIRDGSQVLGTLNVMIDRDPKITGHEERSAILSAAIEIQSILNTSEYHFLEENLLG